ncbi:MAG: hypothetical protein ACOC7L_00090 [Acidobacteriota bacterium]
MSPIMLVTVGTSLFTSATWQPQPELFPDTPDTGGLPSKIPNYDRFLKDHPPGNSPLNSPEERLKADRDGRIREALVRRLTAGDLKDSARAWARVLPPGLADATTLQAPMRFSAELSTILKLATTPSVWRESSKTARDAVPVREFLRTYDAIYVVSDDPGAENRESHVAAVHLAHYLNELAGAPELASVRTFRGLASLDPDHLTAGLRGLQKFAYDLLLEDCYLEVDFVLTGGYKLYSYLLTPLGHDRPGVRYVYLHDRAPELVLLEGHSIKVGDASPLPLLYQEDL